MSDYAATANQRAHNLYGLRIETQLIAEHKRSETWPHFEWRVTLTRVNVISGVDHPFATRTLPYKTGIGHIQTPCGKPLRHGRTYDRPCSHVRCADKDVPTPPDLYSVIGSLRADATHGETFHDWCWAYGFDTDSRSAMNTYIACQTSEIESREFFGLDWSRILSDESFD